MNITIIYIPVLLYCIFLCGKYKCNVKKQQQVFHSGVRIILAKLYCIEQTLYQLAH